MSGSSNESPPRFLYKYRSLGFPVKKNIISIMRDNALWASSYLSSNDPISIVSDNALWVFKDIIKKHAHERAKSGSSNEGLPRFLYKYRSLDESRSLKADDSLGPPAKDYTISSIRNNALWASSPLYFNDPFDCIPRFRMTNKCLKRAIKAYVKAYTNLFDDRKHRRLFIKGKVKYYSSINKVRQLWEDGISGLGIISLSERSDNCLMWSHYADNHKGICIEIRTESFYFDLIERLRVVEYKKTRPDFDYVNTSIMSALDEFYTYPIFSLLCRKSKDWEYEKEWRYMHLITKGSTGTSVKLPPGSITRIIVGAKASDECQREIEDIVKQSDPNIKVVKAKLDDNEYKIVV